MLTSKSRHAQRFTFAAEITLFCRETKSDNSLIETALNLASSQKTRRPESEFSGQALQICRIDPASRFISNLPLRNYPRNLLGKKELKMNNTGNRRDSRYVSVPTLCVSLVLAHGVAQFCETHDHGVLIALAMYLAAFVVPIYLKRRLFGDARGSSGKQVHQAYLARLPRAF